MKEFGKNMAKLQGAHIGCQSLLFILHTLLGEMSMLILEGQHRTPQKAIEHGYQYKLTLEHALQNIIPSTM